MVLAECCERSERLRFGVAVRTGAKITVVFRTWGTFLTCPARRNRAPLISVTVLSRSNECQNVRNLRVADDRIRPLMLGFSGIRHRMPERHEVSGILKKMVADRIVIVLTGAGCGSYHSRRSSRSRADTRQTEGRKQRASISLKTMFRKLIPDSDRVTQNSIMVRTGNDRFGDYG